MAGTPSATCSLTDTITGKTLSQYVNECRPQQDNLFVNNFFNMSYADGKGGVKTAFKAQFESVRAQTDDLIRSGDGIASMSSLTGTTASSVNTRINSLQKKKDMLLAEIKATQAQAEGADRGFLDSIMNGNPQEESIPTLQDASLMIFWFGWLVMALTLIAVRWFSPEGGWRAGAFTAILLFLVTICVYALLQQVA
jgi:hypothetical protein